MIPLRDTEPSFTKPVVTVMIIVINVFAFFFEIALDEFSHNELMAVFGIVPARLQYSSLITSMFLHGGWMHLIGNMWFLWIYGDNIEDILGHGKYLLFYLACGVAAGLVHVIAEPSSRIPTIGASGAIAGVMGAYMAKFPHSKILTLVPLIIFFTTFEIPAVLILAYWFLLQLFSGVGQIGYSSAAQGGIAFWAHIGGFVAGYVLIRMLPTRQRFSHRPDYHW